MSTHTLIVEADHNDLRLDVYLTQSLPDAPSRTFVKKLIDAGHVVVNGEPAKANYKVSVGDKVACETPEEFLAPDDIDAENIPLDIFYEDNAVIVVNKPIGMLVHPATGIYTGTLVNALLYHSQNLSEGSEKFRPGIVHRLDQDTSGLLVVAKDNKTHQDLAKQFEEHSIMKRYIALVEGEIEFDQGVIDAAIGRNPFHRDKKTVAFDNTAKEAVTFYETLKRKNRVTLVALFPQSGRTHQLRVHMSHLGHPILGDVKYGKKQTFPRLALHAQSLGFVHPKTKRYIEFSSTIPKDFLKQVA